MSAPTFKPTAEQEAVIAHRGSAFVNACPGAGKTRVMVERAAHVFQTIPPGRGVAFLSFTKAAVSELEMRLRERAILPVPLFPSFIGTFDAFVWQFLVGPFGAYHPDTRPRLVPDLDDLPVKPFDAAQPIPMACFDSTSGKLNHQAARRAGFDPAKRKPHQIRQYETTAGRIRDRQRRQGHLGFDDARAPPFELTAHFSPLTPAQQGRLLSATTDDTLAEAAFGLIYPSPGSRIQGRPTLWAGRFRATPEPGCHDMIRHVYLPPLRDARQALASGNPTRINALLQHFLEGRDPGDVAKRLGRANDHQILTDVGDAVNTGLEALTTGVRRQNAALGFSADEKLIDIARDLRFKLADHESVGCSSRRNR